MRRFAQSSLTKAWALRWLSSFTGTVEISDSKSWAVDVITQENRSLKIDNDTFCGARSWKSGDSVEVQEEDGVVKSCVAVEAGQAEGAITGVLAGSSRKATQLFADDGRRMSVDAADFLGSAFQFHHGGRVCFFPSEDQPPRAHGIIPMREPIWVSRCQTGKLCKVQGTRNAFVKTEEGKEIYVLFKEFYGAEAAWCEEARVAFDVVEDPYGRPEAVNCRFVGDEIPSPPVVSDSEWIIGKLTNLRAKSPYGFVDVDGKTYYLKKKNFRGAIETEWNKGRPVRCVVQMVNGREEVTVCEPTQSGPMIPDEAEWLTGKLTNVGVTSHYGFVDIDGKTYYLKKKNFMGDIETEWKNSRPVRCVVSKVKGREEVTACEPLESGEMPENSGPLLRGYLDKLGHNPSESPYAFVEGEDGLRYFINKKKFKSDVETFWVERCEVEFRASTDKERLAVAWCKAVEDGDSVKEIVDL